MPNESGDEQRRGCYALVNIRAHRAIVMKDGHPAVMIEIKTNGEVDGPKPIPPGLHLGMWLQPAEAFEWEADDEPYTAITGRVRETCYLDWMFLHFSMVLDPSNSLEIRELAAQELEGYLQTELGRKIEPTMRSIVLDRGLPEEASTRDAPFVGKGREIIDEAIAACGHRPRDA